MTEKRFITNDPYGYSRIFYDGSRLDNKKVCKKLNALNEENEQLKQDMVIINNILNEYYTSNPSETIKNKLTCLLKELELFREAHNTVNWQAYKEKEFEGL